MSKDAVVEAGESEEDEGEQPAALTAPSFAHDLQSRRRPLQHPRKLFWADDTDYESETDMEPDRSPTNVARSSSYGDLNSRPAGHPGQDPAVRAVQQHDLSLRNRSRSESAIPGMMRPRSGSVLRKEPTVKSKADVVIAVVGPRGTGKSTVISKATNKKLKSSLIAADSAGNQGELLSMMLKKLCGKAEPTVTSYLTSVPISQGLLRTVEILEIDSAVLQYGPEGVIWPNEWPQVDGAMICYNAQDKSTVPAMRLMIKNFWLRGGIKMIVLACKSASNAPDNAVDPNAISQILNPYGAGLVELTGGLDDPTRKMRNAFKWIVRSIAEARGELPDNKIKTARRFSKTGSKRPASALSQTTDHTSESGTKSPAESPLRQSNDLPTILSSPLHQKDVPSSPESGKSANLAGPLLPLSAIRIPDVDLYYHREDLVDKFLYAAVAENDEIFVSSFIIIFRKFARPTEVLNKLLERYHFVAARMDTNNILAQYAQMRLCSVLYNWMSTYPGDFIFYLSTPGNNLKAFLEKLLFLPHLNHYAIDLLPLIKVVERIREDPETWALPDVAGSEGESPLMPRKASMVSTAQSVTSTLPSVPPTPLFDSPTLVETLEDTPSQSSTRPRGMSDADLSATSASSQHSDPTGSRRFGRRSGEFTLLDISNEIADADAKEVACQITRLAWQIFSDICPRDLIRYVLAPRGLADSAAHQKSPVNRSIRFLNFLSDWVASLILVQPKAKNRMRLFEKFINIASSLRDMENFDSLMGVLAGMNAQPVYRLNDEFEPLKFNKEKEYKRFKSLNRLMSNSKSFAAYRMALGSSSQSALPYLGCHLQDITKTNEGKNDNRNALVNWSKCLQLATSAAVVSDCVKHAPKMNVNEKVERLIVDVPVHSLEDDTLYQLSYSYKPRSGKPQSHKFRRFLDQMLATQGSVSELIPKPQKTFQAE